MRLVLNYVLFVVVVSGFMAATAVAFWLFLKVLYLLLGVNTF